MFYKMKKSTIYVLALILVAKLIPTIVLAQGNPVPFAYNIKAEDLKKHLTFLASDSLKGRNTGSAEQKVAANYIADHFKKVGLAPVQGSYFQKVGLVNRSWSNVLFSARGKNYEYMNQFMATALAPVAANSKLSAVFAGFGVEQGAYTDFSQLKAKGAIVMAFEGEAKDESGNYVLSGTKDPSVFGKGDGWKEKLKRAQAAGAKGLILISSKSEKDFANDMRQRQIMMKRFSNERMVFTDEAALANEAPVLMVSAVVAAEILGTTEAELLAFKSDLVRQKKSISSKFKPAPINLTIERTEKPVDTYNVVGFLEGTDKKEEVIVITAHYDHIGVSKDGKINNGANDDGSGTVTVMQVAEAFGRAAAAGNKPRRSILFMTVTGEEKGLLGSEYYSNHPLFPLENTVCDLNIDMTGRRDEGHEGKPDYIYVIGSDKLSSQLHDVLLEQNKNHMGLDLDFTFNDPNDPNRFYYRSDHYNFAKKKIPVAFFFNGVHEDYHQPTDDVEKIDFDQVQKIGRLVFYMAWDITNRNERLKVDSNKP